MTDSTSKKDISPDESASETGSVVGDDTLPMGSVTLPNKKEEEGSDATSDSADANGASARAASPKNGVDSDPPESDASGKKDEDEDPSEEESPAPSKAPSAPENEAEPAAADGIDATLVMNRKAHKKSLPGVRLQVFGRTDVGQVREHNEDNFLIADLTRGSRGLLEGERVQDIGERGTVLAVCDGMGGAAAGEVASQLAVDIVYQRMMAGDLPTDHDELAGRLVSAIEMAGMRIFAEAKADRSRRGMGTTSTVAALVDDHLFLGQVGDSRGYLLRGDRLVQVTRDQSLVNQLIEAGQLTEEEAETFEHNNIILQALGTAESVQVDLTYVELRQGDTLLLCSDGLSGMIRNDEIREVLLAYTDPLEACRELTDRANLAGGHDNVTVVVAKFDGASLTSPSKGDVEELKYRKYELPEAARIDSYAIRSTRPSAGPDIEVGYDEGSEGVDDDDDNRSDEPVVLPTDPAPSWIVAMLIVSAVTCVVVVGYYLLY